MRRVEAVIHARGQPQRDETSIAVLLHQRGIAKQVEQRVRRALDLEQLGVGDLAECADDAVAWTDHDRWVGINGPETRSKLARKAIVQALEFGLFRLRQIEVGKQPPAGDREVPHQRVLDLAEPTHESGDGSARNAVGQQEIQVFLLGPGGYEAFDCHESVNGTD